MNAMWAIYWPINSMSDRCRSFSSVTKILQLTFKTWIRYFIVSLNIFVGLHPTSNLGFRFVLTWQLFFNPMTKKSWIWLFFFKHTTHILHKRCLVHYDPFKNLVVYINERRKSFVFMRAGEIITSGTYTFYLPWAIVRNLSEKLKIKDRCKM